MNVVILQKKNGVILLTCEGVKFETVTKAYSMRKENYPNNEVVIFRVLNCGTDSETIDLFFRQ